MAGDLNSPPTTFTQVAKKRKLATKADDSAWKKKFKSRNIHELEGPDHLIASELPDGFPRSLAFRALAAYSLLRTLSRELRLSPFTPNAFLRALNLQYPSRLLGLVHVALLRILLPTMGYSYRERGMALSKKRKIDGLRWDLKAGDNLTYLDCYTWPIFYDDYIHFTADIIYEKLRDSTNHIDFRSLALNIQCDPEDFVEETVDSENATTQVSRVRGFSLPTRQGSRILSKQIVRKGNNVRSKPAPFQPIKRKQGQAQEHGSDSSVDYEDTDEDYDECNMPTYDTITPQIPLKSESSKDLTRTNDGSRSPLSISPHPPYPAHLQSNHYNYNQTTQFQRGGVPIGSTYQSTNKPTTHVVPSDKLHETLTGQPLKDPGQPTDSSIPWVRDYTETVPSQREKRELDRLSGPENIQKNQPVTSSCHVQTELAQNIPRSSSPGRSTFAAVPFHGRPNMNQSSLSYRSDTIRPGTSSMLFNKPRAIMQIPRPGVAAVPQMLHKPRTSSQRSIHVTPTAKERRIVVSDEIADSIEQFLSGKSVAKTLNTSFNSVHSAQLSDSMNRPNQKEESKCGDSNVIQPETSTREEEDKWAHFIPVELMRDGLPYHRLPLLQKLQIIEFLIDELLSLDVIAAEFTRREVVTSCYLNPFGIKPTDEELEALENADECGICGLEGDLICCDGCPSSYHRRCLGMDPRAVLPDGKWLCAECQIKDPAHFGSLNDDRKASVDWFKINDLKKIHEEASASSHFLYTNPSEQSTSLGQACYQIQHFGHGEITGKSLLVTSDGTKEGDNSKDHATQGNHIEESHDVKEDDILVVHGYVFKKPPLLRAGRDSLDKFEIVKKSSSSGHILSTEEIYSMCLSVGSKQFSHWPLVQIPLRPKKIWNAADCRPDNMMQYLAVNTSFDPSKYNSAYRLAPLPKSWGSGAKHPELVLADYESKCHHVETKMLAVYLTADMSSDRSLLEGLHVNTSLFNPYAMICRYLEKLELSLSRAGLLAYSWGLRSKSYQQKTWIRNVHRCRSVPRLSKLLLELVDATHSAAFTEEWFESQFSRSTKKDISGFDEKRAYETLADDWNPETEILKKQWETCSDSNVLSLLAANSRNLSEFVDGASFRHRLIGRKKKIVEMPKSHKTAVEVQSKTIRPNPTAIASSFQSERNEEGSLEHIPELRGRRQRRGREAKIADVKEKNISSCANIREGVELARTRKMKDIQKRLLPPIEKELNWPVCGRYFFDPTGYLPASEMRRLGRNAGTVVAPYMVYLKSHEVAQGAFCHTWRKWCLDCDSYERLVFLVRCLQSFLNQEMISACDGAMRRYAGPKAVLAKKIACSRRDLSSGEQEYFVLHKGRNRGCWIPLNRIDASVFVVERERQAEKFRQAWSRKKAAAESEAEKKRVKEEILRKARVEAKRKAEIESKRKAQNEAKIALQTKKFRPEGNMETQTTPNMQFRQGQAVRIGTMSLLQQQEPHVNKQQIHKVQAVMMSILQQHENETFRMLLALLNPGMKHENVSHVLRAENLRKLRQQNAKIEAYSGRTFNDKQLREMIEERENAASNKLKKINTGAPANGNWQELNQNFQQSTHPNTNALPVQSITGNQPKASYPSYTSQQLSQPHRALNQMANMKSPPPTQLHKHDYNAQLMEPTPFYENQLQHQQHFQQQQHQQQQLLLQRQQQQLLLQRQQQQQQQQYQQQQYQQQQYQQQQYFQQRQNTPEAALPHELLLRQQPLQQQMLHQQQFQEQLSHLSQVQQNGPHHNDPSIPRGF